MHYSFITICLVLSLNPIVSADVLQSLIKDTRLVFEDQFDRSEIDESKEQLGRSYKTNSSSRAKGEKQADLSDGVLKIQRSVKADHGVSIVHPVNTSVYQDAVFQCRFKLTEPTGFKITCRDLKAKKTVHAGRIMRVQVTSNTISIQDNKTGIGNLKLREQFPDKKEFHKEIANKILKFPTKVPLNTWQTLIFTIKNDTVSVYLNNSLIGEFKSSGFSHPTKDVFAFAVPEAVSIDWIKIWTPVVP